MIGDINERSAMRAGQVAMSLALQIPCASEEQNKNDRISVLLGSSRVDLQLSH
jgi:hypothetical protein